MDNCNVASCLVVSFYSCSLSIPVMAAIKTFWIKDVSKCVTSLLKLFYNFLSQSKHQSYHIGKHSATSLGCWLTTLSLFTLLQTHEPLVDVWIRHVPAAGPLHLLSPTSVMLLPIYPHDMLLHLLPVSTETSASHRDFLWSPHLKLQSPHSTLYPPSLFYFSS